MLTTIKQYLRQRRRANLLDIAHHLDAQPDAVREMIQRWVVKGKVREIREGKCGTCCGCEVKQNETYEWIVPQAKSS